jgi:hypothetical protein
MSGPFLFLTPLGLKGRTILVNFTYVLRAEPGPHGKGTSLTLIRDSDPDGLKTLLVEETMAAIAGHLQGGSTVSGEPPPPTSSEVYGVSFPPPRPTAVETMTHPE